MVPSVEIKDDVKVLEELADLNSKVKKVHELEI